MQPYEWWWHGMGFMWMFPLFFFLAIIVCVLFIFRGPWSTWRGDHGRHGSSPREILDRRLASGEITKEQYEDLKRTLGV